ncbi:Toxin co-regulated pilus biosynthesis protein Q [compost metagenome]
MPASGELPAAGEKPSVATNDLVPAGQLAAKPQTANAGGAATAEATPEIVTVDATPTPAVAEPEIIEPPKQIWRISPQDGTVRQALVRWAADAYWTFGPDQWELNFDLPIQAPAEFEAASFQEATQALSQAVAMTESPIRPCFYGNRVLRVVPFTRSCNRSPATQS